MRSLRAGSTRVFHNGKSGSLMEWGAIYGLSRITLRQRYNRGLRPETGLFDPPRHCWRNSVEKMLRRESAKRGIKYGTLEWRYWIRGRRPETGLFDAVRGPNPIKEIQ